MQSSSSTGCLGFTVAKMTTRCMKANAENKIQWSSSADADAEHRLTSFGKFLPADQLFVWITKFKCIV